MRLALHGACHQLVPNPMGNAFDLGNDLGVDQNSLPPIGLTLDRLLVVAFRCSVPAH